MRISRIKLLILVVMSAIGLWASGSVLVIFYTLNQQLPFCPTGTVLGINLDCGAVLSSPYSKILGVPLELLAMGYFLVNLGLVSLVAFGSQRVSDATLEILFGWRFIGIIIVPYLMFVEFFIIHAICVYCTIMHVAIIADFVVISFLLFFGKNSLFREEQEMLPAAAAGGPALQ
ncbi:MAG: vitamin K epoxide reductase family protein [Thaumarchaeota archaeon]|nr:vitamin K epoxide reductase family protein [Nitrososphaerota archaeon]